MVSMSWSVRDEPSVCVPSIIIILSTVCLYCFPGGVPFQVVYKESLVATPHPPPNHPHPHPPPPTIQPVADYETIYSDVTDYAEDDHIKSGLVEPVYVELESSASEEDSGCSLTHCAAQLQPS